MTDALDEWPPGGDVPKGDVARAAARRLAPEFGPGCVRGTSANWSGEAWEVRVAMWPFSPDVVEKVGRLLAPVKATVTPQPEAAGPPRR